jgi:hypothetical protein
MTPSFDLPRAETQLEKLRVKGDVSSPKPGEAFLQLHPHGLAQLDCGFKMGFLFHKVYEQSCVPMGCSACFKIKAAPKTVAGLAALSGILEALPHHAKCGLDFYNPHSRDIYAGFVYLSGLEAARQAYGPLRAAIDAHPDLGPSVRLTIKRGCSEHEAHCGPSDQWSFDPAMADFEAKARQVYSPNRPDELPLRLRKAAQMVKWIAFAYQMGDDSYLSLTGGKPLFAATVSYSPDGA